MAVVGAVIVTAALTALVTVAATSGDDPSAREAQPRWSSFARTTTTAPSPEYAVGQSVTNGGITLTVNEVSSPPSFQQVSNATDKNSEYAEFETVTPRTGGKFIRVDATVLNNTRAGIDLTCSWPVNALAVDMAGNNYKPVDDLYKLPGTPDCNENLNPGFSSKMTWIFEVPASADVQGFAFADTAANAYAYSMIRLGLVK